MQSGFQEGIMKGSSEGQGIKVQKGSCRGEVPYFGEFCTYRCSFSDIVEIERVKKI